MKHIITPIDQNTIKCLNAGDRVLLTGEIYTARDQAHKRLVQMAKAKKKLPLDLKTSVIYYCGPTPAPPKQPIGSCGPTTASRMDSFTLQLIQRGHRVMIGKGGRRKSVQQGIKKAKGVYFVTYGGCGAYLQSKVIKRKVIAFSELGPEAIYQLTVKDFPLIVGIDAKGNAISTL